MLNKALAQLPSSACVLDYGCFGWKVFHAAQEKWPGFVHYGCDIATPDVIPAGAQFRKVDMNVNVLPFEDDFFDLVVASHVIEHVENPLGLFQDLVRICKPGGLLYLEAPSDRSVLCKSATQVEHHSFYSFWDDPTHRRPWSPAALYRLALSYGCDPLESKYIGTFIDVLLYPLRRAAALLSHNHHAATDAAWKAYKWSSYSIIRKPTELRGKPDYRYITLQYVPSGKINAIAHSQKTHRV